MPRALAILLSLLLSAPLPALAQDQAPKAPAAAPPAGAAAAPAPSIAAPAPAAAEAQVEGMLFFASNDATAPAQEEKVTVDATLLKNTTTRLGKTFKYGHFHIIGHHSQKIFKEYESWVVPSKDLCLKMDSRGPADGGGVKLHLQLWQDKKVLVKSDTIIRKDRPVFLGGPNWRGGRLIFVVVLK